MDRSLARRRMLIGGVAAAAAAVLAACTRRSGDETAATDAPTSTPFPASPAGTLEPTPACEPQGEFTPAQTEGPFYKPSSPQKTNLAADVDGGTKLVLTGWVLATDCTPVARATLDFWQADDDGNYDNQGFRLRGHQLTDSNGRYRLETVVPAPYPGRTRHIHVKVQPPTGALLTTQLYFPDEAQNATDSIFNERLLMDIEETEDGRAGMYTFVVVTA